MKKIKKAVVTAAGFGTRFLPISKTVKKEMMPVLNRPVLDYTVAQCYQAGIEEIIFVTKERESIIQWYYSESRSLVQHMEEMGKLEKYQHFLEFLDIQRNINFRFVEQTQHDGYGTTIPVKISKKYLQDEEAFLVLMGDDFIYQPDGSSSVEAMIKHYQASKADGLITCIPRPREELYRYGVAEVEKRGEFEFLKSLQEKPAPGTEASNLTNISKYIMTPAIFEIIDQQKIDPKSGEYFITDTVTTFNQNHDVVVYKPSGEYLDCGQIGGWLKANLRVAKDDPVLRKELTTYIKQEFLD